MYEPQNSSPPAHLLALKVVSAATTVQLLHRVQKKHPEYYRLTLKEELSNFNNVWHESFQHNWPPNVHSVFHLTQCLLLHYLGKTEPMKYELK